MDVYTVELLIGFLILNHISASSIIPERGSQLTFMENKELKILTTIYSSQLTNVNPIYRPPGFADSLHYYEAIRISVSPGIYHIQSTAAFAALGTLYRGGFNATDPSENIISQNENYNITTNSFGMTVNITAGEVYILVITAKMPGDVGKFTITSNPSSYIIPKASEATIHSNTTTAKNVIGNQTRRHYADVTGDAVIAGILEVLGFIFVPFLIIGFILFCCNCFISSEKLEHIFQPGSYIGYIPSNTEIKRGQKMTLAFYPQAGHIVYGRGTEDFSSFIIRGVYSPRTLGVSFDKIYQSAATVRGYDYRKATVQMKWNKKTQQFEGNCYSRNNGLRRVLPYIVRKDVSNEH